MINIQKLIEQATENGYQGDNASAKVCQDIVLKALATGPLSRNVTIKGGVVMRSKTNYEGKGWERHRKKIEVYL